MIRHAVPLPPEDIVVRHGLHVTSLERTVYDVIRMRGLETALACYDAALRLVAWDGDSHSLDEKAAAAFTATIETRIRAHTGARGIRQARLVRELADGRAQLPGESVSRLRMWELRLPTPELQCHVRTREGNAYLDFAWPELHLFGECDGAVKLVDPRFTRGRTPAQVLADAEHRHRLVEQATGWTGFRWGADAYEDASTFAALVRTHAPRLLSAPR